MAIIDTETGIYRFEKWDLVDWSAQALRGQKTRTGSNSLEETLLKAGHSPIVGPDLLGKGPFVVVQTAMIPEEFQKISGHPQRLQVFRPSLDKYEEFLVFDDNTRKWRLPEKPSEAKAVDWYSGAWFTPIKSLRDLNV